MPLVEATIVSQLESVAFFLFIASDKSSVIYQLLKPPTEGDNLRRLNGTNLESLCTSVNLCD